MKKFSRHRYLVVFSNILSNPSDKNILDLLSPYHTHAELVPGQKRVYREKDMIDIIKKLAYIYITNKFGRKCYYVTAYDEQKSFSNTFKTRNKKDAIYKMALYLLNSRIMFSGKIRFMVVEESKIKNKK